MHQTAKGHCCITFCEALPEACSSLVTQVTQSVIHSGYHRLEPERLYRSMPCPEVDIERAPTFSSLRPLRFEQHQHPFPLLRAFRVCTDPKRSHSLLSIPSLIPGLSRTLLFYTFLFVLFISLDVSAEDVTSLALFTSLHHCVTALLHHSHHCHLL